MNKIKKKKNLISFEGIRIIDSSAGTGKTFTIIFLYLKLLLGINNKKKIF